MKKIVEKIKDGPLKDELAQMLKEMKLGKTRKDALRDMALRVDLPDLSAVVFSIIQAEQLGTGISTTIKIEAEQLRIKRSYRAEKMALEAPVKLMFPLVIFIFPTVFIVIIGPIILKLMEL